MPWSWWIRGSQWNLSPYWGYVLVLIRPDARGIDYLIGPNSPPVVGQLRKKVWPYLGYVLVLIQPEARGIDYLIGPNSATVMGKLSNKYPPTLHHYEIEIQLLCPPSEPDLREYWIINWLCVRHISPRKAHNRAHIIRFHWLNNKASTTTRQKFHTNVN